MKATCCLAFLAIACALPLAASYYYNTTHHYAKYKVADKEFLQKQKSVLELYMYINQPTQYKDFIEIYKSFSIESNASGYTNMTAYKDFMYYYKLGFLGQDEMFSEYYEPHLQQAIALFNMFYYAKDWDTFYKTAVWSQFFVNPGMYVYALSVAIVHRDDMYGIVLPPIYEVLPNYFFNSEVIYKAQKYKQMYSGSFEKPTSEYGYMWGQGSYGEHHSYQSVGGYKGYNIFANYSGWYMNLDPEQYISYFTEDVGINAYYYYYNLYYPFWMNGDEFGLKNDHRGELFYYVHQQLLARYYLERLSNNFGEIPTFDFEYPIETGYYPSMYYPNGIAFPERSAYQPLLNMYNNYGISYSNKGQYAYSYYKVMDYMTRIYDAIDFGYAKMQGEKSVDLFGTNGFETLANLVESNPNSPNPNYYGPYQLHARFVLGGSYIPLTENTLVPSALQHAETSLRDPMFWQLYKQILSFFFHYKEMIPSYTYNELYFPGVSVENVEFDKLVTYFDYFYSYLSNAVYVTEKEAQEFFPVKAQQHRLNYKPFTYKIVVNSEKDVDAVVRTFIGPKFDEYGREINMNENKYNFVEFDKFVYQLKAGQNVIEHNSFQNEYVVDRTSFKDLYERVSAALNGKGDFLLDGSEAYYGFPKRFLLPKGKVGGQTFQMYVMISPYHPTTYQEHQGEYYYPKVGTGDKVVDKYPMGYPFDKNIDESNFYVPNSYFKDIVIYHKKVEEQGPSNYPYNPQQHTNY